ncbi:MAG: 6-phosphogluconolactonase [Rhizobiaceae bacterium]|nr:6-phosphogluconolactonase [Rhizobiaceae bacterium]
MVRWHEFGSSDAIAAALAERIASALTDAVAARGSATLAVSGGRTPRHLFDALSQTEITWDKVTVTLVDERFVAPDNERSNEKLVRDLLLQNRAAAKFVPLFRDGMSLEEAAKAASGDIDALSPPLDVVVLGMGPDGHTASFFPDAENLEALYANAAGSAVLPVLAPSAGEPRLTLSAQLIAAAGLLVLHTEGEERRSILTAALAEGELPVARVLQLADTKPQIYWAA